MESKVGVIILSAGKSSRMGDFKPLLKIGDETILEREIKTAKSAGIEEIIVVTGYGRERLSGIVEAENVIAIYNDKFEEGMFTSIKKGVVITENSKMTGVLLMLVDCPLISDKILKEIIKTHEENPDKMIVPCFRGKKGHPLLLPKRLMKEVLEHEGSRGLKGVTDKYEDDMIRLEVGTEAVILDMDTKEGYAEVVSFYEKNDISPKQLERNDYRIKYINLLREKGIKRLFLIRHGQPIQHKSKIFLGQKDLPLSEIGRAEATETGRELAEKNLKSKVMYTSDLKRARETAEIIGGVMDSYKMEIKNLGGFREINLGLWDGEYMDDIKRKFPNDFEKRGKNLLAFKRGSGSENFYDLQYRVLKTLEKLVANHEDEDLVIISHSGVMRIIYGNLNGISLDEAVLMPIKTSEILEINVN